MEMGKTLYGFVDGSRKDIERWYHYSAKKIQASGNGPLKSFLKSHIAMTEDVAMKLCKKTVRRKRVIAFWIANSSDDLEKIKEACK